MRCTSGRSRRCWRPAGWRDRSTRSAVTTCWSTWWTRSRCCARCGRWRRPEPRLHISIPNGRHFSLLIDLLFRGTFGYTEWGHRDSTHLRWYTRRDIVALVGKTGWDVEWAVADTFRGRNRYVDRLTLRRAREFLALQWHVLARA